MTFAEVTTPRRLEPNAWAHEIPDGWQQGPGAFGGLVLALLTRVGLDFEADPARPLRALQGQVLAPVVPGEVRLTARLLRRGSGLSAVNVQLHQQGELKATADLALAKPRAADATWATLPRPEAPGWQDVEVVPLEPPIAPVFAQHFEYRVLPPFPFSGAERAGANTYVRAAEPGPRCDAPLLVALIDAPWPAPYATLPMPRPMTTVCFTMQTFIDPASLDPGVPLLYRATNPLANEGYTLELRELWTADGRPVAQNQQTFLVIK